MGHITKAAQWRGGVGGDRIAREPERQAQASRKGKQAAQRRQPGCDWSVRSPEVVNLSLFRDARFKTVRFQAENHARQACAAHGGIA
jgi:hypothetical protein